MTLVGEEILRHMSYGQETLEMFSKKGSLSPFLSSDPCLKFATGNYDSSSVFKSHFSQFASFPGS